MAREPLQLVSERAAMSRKGSLSDMVTEFFEELEGERRGFRREGSESDYDENEGPDANLVEDDVFWTPQLNDLQVSYR